jgi:hypothetical protein
VLLDGAGVLLAGAGAAGVAGVALSLDELLASLVVLGLDVIALLFPL